MAILPRELEIKISAEGRIEPITITVRFRWWLWPYLAGLAFFCVLFDREPEPQRFRYWVLRATYIRIGRP